MNIFPALLPERFAHFKNILLLDSNPHYSAAENDFIFAAGNSHEHKLPWKFGHFSYDYKNSLEHLTSSHPDRIRFSESDFFSPELVIKRSNGQDVIFGNEELLQTASAGLQNPETTPTSSLDIKQRFSRGEYIATVKKLKEHIKRGDVYEINFCMEFFAEDAVIDPFMIYRKLNEISGAPFSCFYKQGDRYLLCASPERFLKKKGNKLISQPIKGTARRGKTPEEDEKIKTALRSDLKEQSENVMIVDLVRNDLSKIANGGTVDVDELFGIYTFRQVHQMISTVSCELRDTINLEEIMKAAFPMGSMTGAPKIKAMELIEQYERTKRGLFSGAVGYVSPEGDFDFNVVIRSILYNEIEKYVSFQVGSAITANSVPEKEYEECMLKAKALFEVLEGEKK